MERVPLLLKDALPEKEGDRLLEVDTLLLGLGSEL